MLHKKLFAFVLTLSLIVAFGFAQMRAVSHQINHDVANISALSVAHNTSTKPLVSNETAPVKSLPDHTACEQCIGFGGLTHAHQTAAYTFGVLQNSRLTFGQTAQFSANLKSLSRSARAPPFSLV